MFDFKKEVNRYKPIMEIEEVEKAIHNNEVQDIIDLLKIAINNKKEQE